MGTTADTRIERGIAYAPGRLLDVYRPGPGPGPGPGVPAATVLLWHGVSPDERDVLETLAASTAAHGVTVVVPDWRSDAPDGGRADLLGSLAFTRELAAGLGGLGGLGGVGGRGGRGGLGGLSGLSGDAIVLAGWSRGGNCAASIGVRPGGVDGWRPLGVVCLGSGFFKAVPPAGGTPIEDLRDGYAAPVPFWIVHGKEDTVVPVRASRDFVAALTSKGWPVRFEEPPTDHAGVVGTEYDPELRRCRPASRGHAVAAGALSARLIAEAARHR